METIEEIGTDWFLEEKTRMDSIQLKLKSRTSLIICYRNIKLPLFYKSKLGSGFFNFSTFSTNLTN